PDLNGITGGDSVSNAGGNSSIDDDVNRQGFGQRPEQPGRPGRSWCKGNINTTRIIRGITNPGFIWSTGFNPQGARVSRRHYKGINTRCIDSSHYEGFGCSI
ncbi:hypothetical protein B0T26DRAFT_871157, partial [Lasiosphaeria miniovina]